ncbi:hypothetical protein Cgig2_023440 [Carnegiea gigantea]|uniref:Uncharacterized protein n=1 Tax=Carnegiea gigantea TaxID=171969 RepID=A0A9Q1GRK3_9CARY|nr:hypothetical protein Cgig2_023440 [Carnegiea gigantea]
MQTEIEENDKKMETMATTLQNLICESQAKNIPSTFAVYPNSSSRLPSSKEDEPKLNLKLRKGFRWAGGRFAAGTVAQGFRWAIVRFAATRIQGRRVVEMTKKNNNVKPTADVIWLAEHTHTDDGVLVWVDDKRSKQVHSELHDLVQNKDKEGAPQTQEEMLLQVLGPKSGYTRGKGSGYGGSIKARINEEQQQKICEQQKQIEELQSRLDASQKEMEEHKAT